MTHKTNHEKWMRKQKALRKRKDAWDLVSSVKSQGCQLCGYSKCLGALEFHHVGSSKEFEISARSRSHVSVAKGGKLMREIEKCVVVCANCHREIHAGQIEGFEGGTHKHEEVREDPPLLRVMMGSMER